MITPKKNSKGKKNSPLPLTFAFRVAKHSLVTFLKEPREVRLVSFSLRAEIHPHLYYILFMLFCQHKMDIFNKSTTKIFTFLPLFIILFGIRTVSKIRPACRKPLIYKAFSTFVYYSHSIVPVGLGVKSYSTRLMPGTSVTMREVILWSRA